MAADRNLGEILEENSEVELSEWSADPAPAHPRGEDLGVPDAGVPAQGPDPVPVRPEVGPGALPPPERVEVPAPPGRRRQETSSASVAGGNSQGEPALADVFLVVPKVTALLHLHPQSVLRLVARGDLAAIKPGKRLLIPGEALTAFIEARRVKVRGWAVRRRHEA